MTTFPFLYYKDPKGRVRVWQLIVDGDRIITRYGLVDGTMQTAEKRATPKNEGRSNETTAEQQALIEAEAMWEHKRSRQYSESPIEAATIPVVLPMKLHPYDKQKKKVRFPAWIQPKLDGFRAMAMINPDSGQLEFLSRSGRVYNVPHLEDLIAPVLLNKPNVVLDGEFYVHGRITFEQLSSLVKRNRPESLILEYHVFDAADLEHPTAPFVSRILWAKLAVEAIDSQRVKLVETTGVLDHKEIEIIHDRFVEEGYEGAVVRNVDGLYKFNYRSYDALKVKHFMDEEFKIVSYESGVGKFENCVIWICETKDGKQFKAVPMGTYLERANLLEHAEQHVGKQVTVRFLNWTADGVPRHPIALRFRGKE